MSQSTDWSELRQQVDDLLGGPQDEPELAEEPSSRTITLRITLTEMPRTIPLDSVVELERIQPRELRPGDIVFVLRGQNFIMGRFLRLKSARVVELTREGSQVSRLEEVSARGVLRVVRVRHRGSPVTLQGGKKRWWHRLVGR